LYATESILSRSPLTLAQKIWNSHEIEDLGDETSLLHVDKLLLHERSGGRMLQGVLDSGRTVFAPSASLGVFDHIIDTEPNRGDRTKFPGGSEFISTFRTYAKRAQIPLIEITDARQGISHVIAPELGIAVPGSTIVCGDSHTCTLGGIGALAWGIGITAGEHVLSTQTLAVRRPKQMRVRFEGGLPPGTSAKDLVLELIGLRGASGGRGCIIEYAGSTIATLPVSARMTLCNMAVEFGAWSAIVAPDDVTLSYLANCPNAPKGNEWKRALSYWRPLRSDDDAQFEYEAVVDCRNLSPKVTWGTSPEHVIDITGIIPDPTASIDGAARTSMERALKYMDLRPGQPISSVDVDAAFIGSCTNSRIDDLRNAAAILRGRKIAPNVLAICVPGSTATKRQAEAEGIDRIFREAGFQWRESGCSLCFYSGGDSFGSARRTITSTNRNFENRQGPGVRSHLASPATVAASAVRGRITDPRALDC
jgi:3-isopropylmalate/(R)-2-methylmalate dehydratase large subunit